MAPCGEAAVDRERSRRDRHRAKLALPETGGTEGVKRYTAPSHPFTTLQSSTAYTALYSVVYYTAYT